MPKSDAIPCFYNGQDDTWEKPAREVPRDEARQLKALGLGKFENHGRTFRLNAERPKPVEETLWVPDGTAPQVEGRNSCRAVGEYPDISYRVKHFSYPVPAVGARNRVMNLREINRVPIVLLASASSAQAQA